MTSRIIGPKLYIYDKNEIVLQWTRKIMVKLFLSVRKYYSKSLYHNEQVGTSEGEGMGVDWKKSGSLMPSIKTRNKFRSITHLTIILNSYSHPPKYNCISYVFG